MYKVGIIECGKIAQVRHISKYFASPETEIAGYFDLNTQRAQELSAAHGDRVYVSYQEMLSDPAIDVVSVCTINTTHAEIATAVLHAGKCVLCEKPMAFTLEECEAMVAAAHETGRLLIIGHNQGLTQVHMLAKQLMEEGIIGRLLTFRTTFGHGGPETWSIDAGKITWFFDKKRASMGAMADLGTHKTDLIQFLSGQKVTEVTARLTTLDKTDASGNLIDVDDNVICIYRLSDGAIRTVIASWTYYGAEDNSTILYGTKGILRIYDDPEYATQLIRPNGEIVLYRMDQIQTSDNQTSSGMIDRFAACLGGEDLGHLSEEAAFSAIRAVLACIESSQTGRAAAIHQEGSEIG